MNSLQSWRVSTVPGTLPCKMSYMTKRLGGRPSKGERYAAKTRLPMPVAEAVRAEHEESGMPISDVIARYVAVGIGLPEYAPEPPTDTQQQELPVQLSA